MYLYFFLLTYFFIDVNGIGTDNFICIDGNVINITKMCNGVIDCPDGSDETKDLCYHTICPKNMFRCYYGACVQQVKKCNGRYECADKSDESQCGRAVGSCEKNEFRCKSGQCIPIKNLCDDKEECFDGSDENKETCEELPCPENSFRCKYGGCIHLDARCNKIQDCIDGSDETNILCKNLYCKGRNCIKLKYKVHCPAADLSRINAICQSTTGRIVPCDNPVPIGAKIKYQCKAHFVPMNYYHINNKQAYCQFDGTWSRKLLKCKPDCGRINSNAVTLVVKGWDTNKFVYPWYAQMYVADNGKWEFWCGGTLITEKVVLTAAHCIWQVEENNIKLAFNKYYSDFNKRESTAQIVNVKKILSPSVYQDRNGNYGSDIAVLVLRETVKLSAAVHPACVDWDLRDMSYHLRENSLGLVAGMGITEAEEFSETLRAVYLPVISSEQCIQDQLRDFRKYITYTIFCAGWKNGTAVCNGDSGGGLLFPKVRDNSRWTIQGIVSVSPRKVGTLFCDPQFYTVFTKVGSFMDWLKFVLKQIGQSII